MTAEILAAILSLLPARSRPAESARLEPLAAAIGEAVEAADVRPFSKRDTALALVAIAWHESAFRQDVIECRRRGPSGDATAFQLLGPAARGPYTVKELCASPRLAAERAVWVLSRCRRTALGAFRGYASGRCDRPAPVYIRLRGELVLRDPDGGMTRCRTWARLVGAEAARCEGSGT